MVDLRTASWAALLAVIGLVATWHYRTREAR